MSFEQMYSLLLTAIAVGSVLAGIVVGAIGDRIAKGPMVIAGFIGMGLSLVAAGLVRDPVLAMLAFFFTGAFNMIFIIPTVTLFQERTPQRLMGRVVSSRQALVFGAIAASMGLSGYFAGIIGPAEVLVISGAICAGAGLVGIADPCHAQRPLARDLLAFPRRGTDPQPGGHRARPGGDRIAGPPGLDAGRERGARHAGRPGAGRDLAAIRRRCGGAAPGRLRARIGHAGRARRSAPTPSWETDSTDDDQRTASASPATAARCRPANDRLARPWILTVIAIFVLIIVLAILGVPSRFIPDPTPIPLPSIPAASDSPEPSPSPSRLGLRLCLGIRFGAPPSPSASPSP